MANGKTADFFKKYQKTDPAALLELIAALEQDGMSSDDRIELNRIKQETQKRLESNSRYRGYDEW